MLKGKELHPLHSIRKKFQLVSTKISQLQFNSKIHLKIQSKFKYSWSLRLAIYLIKLLNLHFYKGFKRISFQAPFKRKENSWKRWKWRKIFDTSEWIISFDDSIFFYSKRNNEVLLWNSDIFEWKNSVEISSRRSYLKLLIYTIAVLLM